MEALTGLLAAAGLEALKSWGSLGISVLLLGLMLWLSDRRGRSKDAEIATQRANVEKLRDEIDRLQEARLQDAREMIRVTKSGTETMAARAAGDADFRQAFSQLLAYLSASSQVGATPTLPPPASRATESPR